MNWFEIWMIKPIAEFVGKMLMTVSFFGFIVLVLVVCSIPKWIKQGLCKHDDVYESGTELSAVCRKCGKNLGFILSWREKHKEV